MKKFYFLMVLIFAFISSTVFAGKPYWVDKEHEKYGSKRYITAIGIGETRETSENEARANLAKIFNAKIESETKDFMQTVKKYEKKKVRATSIEDVNQITKVSTDKVIEGSIIAEVKKHKKTYYALAVLDRMKTTNILSDKITALDTEIKELVTEAEKTLNKITKIKNLKKAMPKLIEREAVDSELKIVSPVGMGIDSPYTPTEISQRLDKLLSEDFKLSVEIEGNYIREVTSSLKEALTNLGFTITNKTESSDINITGNIIMEPVDHPDKTWKWVKYESTFSLIDKNSQNTIGNITKTGTVGQLTLDAAYNKALLTLNNDISDEISKEISKYIFGTNT